MSLVAQVKKLKEERNAVILAHNYQVPEVQDVADFVGDSLGLSMQATRTEADVIVFCGVDFMAESAKVLNPSKTVLLPRLDAQCPMAAMLDVEGLLGLKRQHSDAEVVGYVNTSAATKAEMDICCTSSNAVKVVSSLRSKKVIFVPDENLGKWVQRTVKDKEMILWPGFCPTHNSVTPDKVLREKEQHPEARVVAHPECRPEVLDIADAVKSTEGMIKYVKESPDREFIIVTEKELLHRLKKEAPGKKFHSIPGMVCPNMKRTDLAAVLSALQELKHEIVLPEDVMRRARIPLERMMAVGRGD
ncbi:MAG TPA: quinolinate synthase NadA [Methanomassiliicoccales archaeon]|nr:quinolinate synthase NadA [Methanomassiliicoccales archaeon]